MIDFLSFSRSEIFSMKLIRVLLEPLTESFDDFIRLCMIIIKKNDLLDHLQINRNKKDLDHAIDH